MSEVVPYSGGAVITNPAAMPSVPNPGGHVSHQSVMLGLPSDIAISSDDKPIVESFSAAMQAQGVPREIVHKALRWYNQHTAGLNAAQVRSDRGDKTAARVAMVNEWGTAATSNFRAIRQYVGTLPVAVQEALGSAELDDGTLLLNSPAGLRWLFDLARSPSRNAYSGRSMQSAHDELETIRNVMRTDRKRYNRDERMQARYRELLERAQ